MRNRLCGLLALLALTAATPAQAQIDVLLVQTAPPWTTASNQICLDSLGMSYEMVSDWNQIDWPNLNNYRVMLIVNDQTQGFYDGHAAHQQDLDDFVTAGGDLLFFAAGQGWAGGTITAPLPGGLAWHFTGAMGDYANYNEIVDTAHPIVTSQLSDNIPLVNADMNGNYCSHGWFAEDELLNETRVLFRQSANEGGNPTCIDYRVGMGHVVASTNTWEFHYAGMGVAGLEGFFALKNLDDVFLYMLAVGGVTAPDAVIYQHYIETDPDCFDTDVPAGTVIEVKSHVANIAAVGIDNATIHFTATDEFENTQPIGAVTSQVIPAENEIFVGVQWDTTGVTPGEYLVGAEAEVIYPQELLENQDNNYSARFCSISISQGDDDDDDDDDATASDDDDDDDDVAAHDDENPEFGCQCQAGARRGAGPAVLALVLLAALRRLGR